MQHLNDQIVKLEDERDALRTVSRKVSHAPDSVVSEYLEALGPDGREECLEWLRQDHEHLYDEFVAAELRDEDEARAVMMQCKDLENAIQEVEERNGDCWGWLWRLLTYVF